MSILKRWWPRLLILLTITIALLIPRQVTSVHTEDSFLHVIDERTPEVVNNLPMSEGNISRYTPRQYLYIFHPEYAYRINRIIYCESRWVVTAKNNHSTASGLAQFINGTWVSTRKAMGRDPSLQLKYDPYEHIDTAVWLLKHSGIHHWAASKHCHKLM
jgi:hypothetical protein